MFCRTRTSTKSKTGSKTRTRTKTGGKTRTRTRSRTRTKTDLNAPFFSFLRILHSFSYLGSKNSRQVSNISGARAQFFFSSL